MGPKLHQVLKEACGPQRLRLGPLADGPSPELIFSELVPCINLFKAGLGCKISATSSSSCYPVTLSSHFGTRSYFQDLEVTQPSLSITAPGAAMEDEDVRLPGDRICRQQSPLAGERIVLPVLVTIYSPWSL